MIKNRVHLIKHNPSRNCSVFLVSFLWKLINFLCFFFPPLNILATFFSSDLPFDWKCEATEVISEKHISPALCFQFTCRVPAVGNLRISKDGMKTAAPINKCSDHKIWNVRTSFVACVFAWNASRFREVPRQVSKQRAWTQSRHWKC